MDSVKYIGMDVHKEAISIAVLNSAGKLVMECVIETKAITILEFLEGLRGSLHVTFEEGTWAAWLYDLLKPHVTELVVCNPRRNAYTERRQQERPHRCAETCRAVAIEHAPVGLSRRARSADPEGAGEQLSRDQQRSGASDESSEGDLPQLGYSLCGKAGLCTAVSLGVAR